MNSTPGPSPPAFRQKSSAFLMCTPLAHASISFGDAFEVFDVKWKSWNWTLPAPAPPPVAKLPAWLRPQLNDSGSIAPACLSSTDSPSVPSIFKKYSTADTSRLLIHGREPDICHAVSAQSIQGLTIA